MAIQKPSVPKGTRDFSPAEMVRRNYIFDTIRSVYKMYGYLPIETPAMENLDSLTGKYGEEGDQLLFKILNSRPHEAKDAEKEKMRTEFERTLQQSLNSNVLTEKALRYDLTVPFARYVVMHQHEITFPFKRYQIQNVWRGDRPAKGRYREFYQCDADVIGSNSLINEVELVQIIDAVFTNLKVPTLTKINNRKILSGIAEIIGEKENIVKITVAIDKLDKIGVDGVNKELRENGVSETAIEKLQPLISFTGSYTEKIALLKNMLAASETGMKGIAEIEFVFNKAMELGLKSTELELDITLARGLNYYTGAIFEVKAKAGSLTVSICGGGRYDDLTGIFGLPGLSGVGISFGADRIYDVLLDLNLYPEEVAASTKLLFVGFDENDLLYCLPLLKQVRDAGISAELYPDAKRMQKQMAYADSKSIPFVAIVGENERKENVVMLKNMKTGTQEKITVDALIAQLHS
jgi:histidyl-tRNA synthetase